MSAGNSIWQILRAIFKDREILEGIEVHNPEPEDPFETIVCGIKVQIAETYLGGEPALGEAWKNYVSTLKDGMMILPNEGMTIEPRTLTLSADDPFDRVLIDIVETNRRKRRDYAHDGDDPFTNFRVTSNLLGIDDFGPRESALFNILQKIARLQSLRVNGRMDDPANEAVSDTILDLAVYSIIFTALDRELAEQ